MKINRTKKFATAAFLCLSLAYGLHSFSATNSRAATGDDARTLLLQTPILQARGIVTFGGYALNASFTPDGRLLCFDISIAPTPSAARAEECPSARAMRAG